MTNEADTRGLLNRIRLRHSPFRNVKGLNLPMRRFVELVRCGALNQAPDAALFTGDVNWKQLLLTSERQMLVGVTFQAVKYLPAELAPPKDILVRWLTLTSKIQRRNALMDQRCEEAEIHFRSLGFKCCILKGQGLARLYALPSSRMPGDIDLWVDADHRVLTRLALERNAKAHPTYQHVDYHLFDDIELEVHYRPTWMYSPLTNHRLQQFFRREARWDISGAGVAFHVPSLRMNLVFVLVHAYRHFLSEGLGLRQLMDYFFVLRSSSAQERQTTMGVLESLGMKRFTGAVMWVMEQCFGLAREHMLCPPDVLEGLLLLSEIMQAGNFGQFDRRMLRSKDETQLQTFVRKTRRTFHFVTHYPGEILWSVPWRVWNWVMRTANMY